MTTIWSVIATRNEADSIGPMVEGLREYGIHAVVVDESDDDATALTAMGAGAVVISPNAIGTRLGIAQSLMLGWGEALAREADAIVVADAGGSHRPEDVARVANALWAFGADVVIGSRFLPESEYVGRPWRAAASRWVARLCSARSRWPCNDWTSGLRAFRPDVAQFLLRQPFEARMHGWQIEVLGHVIRAGMIVAEVPIAYTAGRSSFGWRVALEAFLAWLEL